MRSLGPNWLTKGSNSQHSRIKQEKDSMIGLKIQEALETSYFKISLKI